MKGRAALVAAALLVAAPSPARGDDARSDAEVTRRLAFIEARLQRATPSAELWWSLWYYGYMTVTVGQAGFAILIQNKNLRVDTAVGAAFSSLGVVGLAVAPLPAKDAAYTLSKLSAGSPAERRRKLAKAEALLSAAAASERIGRTWLPHVTGGAVTLTSALVLGVVYKQVASSIVTFVSGMAITEAQIFSRPTAAIDDWREYQRGAFGAPTPIASSPRAGLGVVPHPGGVGISLAF
jgi:hypothetical protein